MIELPPISATEAAQIVAPDTIHKRKGRRGRRSGAVIGSIILLDDGTACQIAEVTPQGEILCWPVTTP